MKNILLTIVLAAFTISTFANVKGGGSISYVKSGDKIYVGKDLKIGLFNMRIISNDGSVIKLPNKSVEAYMHDSRLYELLPLVDQGQVRGYRMMEYLKARGGLKLYRCNEFDVKTTDYQYYIFRDGKYHLTIDSKNASTVLPFFGVNNFRIGK